MHIFDQYLQEGEQILYEGRPTPVKISIWHVPVGGLFFSLIGFAILFFCYVYGVIEFNDLHEDYILLYIVLVIMIASIYGISSFIYKSFLKKKIAKGDYYCLTNKRVLKYEEKNNKLVFGYLETYDDISSYNIKNNIGDVIFKVDLSARRVVRKVGVIKSLKHINKFIGDKSDLYICFHYVENPRKIEELARHARAEILKNYTK